MIFRWSGAVDYDDQQARERLQGYFEAIGYRCVLREPELMMRRGSLWRGLVSAAPRHILTGVVAKTQPWGAQTLIDVEFYIFQRGRSWQELDAELLVEEARQMIRYLREGEADFQRLQQINQRAIRNAWRATILTLALVAVLAIGIATGLDMLRSSLPVSPLLGGVISGVAAGFLLHLLMRRRRG